jgi:hypothetical protein
VGSRDGAVDLSLDRDAFLDLTQDSANPVRAGGVSRGGPLLPDPIPRGDNRFQVASGDHRRPRLDGPEVGAFTCRLSAEAVSSAWPSDRAALRAPGGSDDG